MLSGTAGERLVSVPVSQSLNVSGYRAMAFDLLGPVRKIATARLSSGPPTLNNAREV